MPTAFTRRDARLPQVAGKVHAVIGMRRAGKTTFLRQLQSERQAALAPERAVYVSFDDDRLADLPLAQLDLLLEEYYRNFPPWRGREVVHWFLDEVQLVTGWERFVRRVLDNERVEMVVSGSSARLLSREVHTSLRGRGMETVIRPFSFREFLRHRGEEPEKPVRRWTAAGRSLIEKRFREYLVEGGFPEAQGLPAGLRVELLQGYVDTLLLRDVVERYGVTQAAALRWLVRQCLRNPAGLMSVHRLYQDLKAQGHGVAKDALHAMLGHLVDAFLLITVPLSTESERRRNSNPRKIYPADPGLIGAFDRSGRANLGHALETVVLNELERRKAEAGYVKTSEGFEVDFHARFPAGSEILLQVCADPSDPQVAERELRALEAARRDYPKAGRKLLVLGREHDLVVRTTNVAVQPAYEWLLGEDEA
ncbi:MAG: ATP-binding protein [Nitrospirae bacterium]|nr:ATP-binding protein [Nitrospirota bacterium]